MYIEYCVTGLTVARSKPAHRATITTRARATPFSVACSGARTRSCPSASLARRTTSHSCASPAHRATITTRARATPFSVACSGGVSLDSVDPPRTAISLQREGTESLILSLSVLLNLLPSTMSGAAAVAQAGGQAPTAPTPAPALVPLPAATCVQLSRSFFL